MIKHKWLLLSVVSVLILGTLGFGADAVMKISASVANDMGFSLDGVKWQPLDVDGSPMSPIIYNGRSYVPARALLEKFGVGVGYSDITRTILLTSKEMDKSSPKLAEVVMPETATAPLVIEYDLERVKALGMPKLTQETTLDLADTVEVWVDGVKSTKSITELATSDKISVMMANVEIDQRTGLVSKIEYHTNPDGGSSQLKVTITIEISSPPFRIKITISF